MTLFLLAAMVAATEPAAVPAEVQTEKPKVVCKSVMVSGSRLARRKICLSEKEWAAEERASGRSSKTRAN